MRSLAKMVHRLVPLVLATVLGVGLAGCEGDDGRNGSDGAAGSDGTPGLNCWDLNGNGVADLATEDTNKDGVVDVKDCRSSGVTDAATFHEDYFTANSFSGTGQCLNCHSWLAGEVMSTGHWKWKGTVANIVGPVDLRGRTHGKLDLINNFCQAVPANEGRCSQCHIGTGWADKSFDFGNPRNIDCLACHDQTGTYEKVQAPSPEQPLAGGPKPGLDLDAIARSVGMNGGRPPRSTCVFCHSRAGGDDNVKHGDISSRFAKTAPDDPNDPNDDPFDRTEDVHMGVDGENMLCVDCHQVDKDASGNVLSHGIGGFAYHSVDEGTMKDCTDCHEDRAAIHAGTSAELVVRLSGHDRLACQVCHIPAVARKVSTYVDWRWSDAGLPSRPANCAAEPLGTGNRATWNQMKGCFTWGTAVRPALRYHNGTWNRRVMGISDTFAAGEGTPDAPVDLGSPAATYRDADAMIYPFKKMTGNQPADAANNTVLVPHLWGKVTGPNPFWRPATDTTPANVRWDLALVDGAAYSGAYNFGNYEPFKPAGTPLQTYSGSFTFADTVMLLKVDHEIPPAEQAFGMDNDCNDCHGGNQVEWTALGYSGDPLAGGTRPE